MRYLGSKIKLLNEIGNFINENVKYNKSMIFCDAFCGTASVSDYMKDKYEIIANDKSYMASCLANNKLLVCNEKKLNKIIDKLNNLKRNRRIYIIKLFTFK